MKEPIKYFVLVFIALSTISCKSTYYQVSTVETESLSESFDYLNDDLRLTYNFWANGGALKFTIENLTDQPIYIDWEHSNFIFNGYSHDYFTKSQTINAVEVYDFQGVSALNKLGTSTKNNGLGVGVSNTEVTSEKESIQLPPKSYVNSEKIYLDFPWLEQMDAYKSADKSDSPLQLRTYIAYSLNKDLSDLKFIDNEFWVKGHSEVKGNELAAQRAKNKFYTKGLKVDKTKTGIGVTLGLLFVLILAR
jgi:hypothetical protein